MATLLGRNVRQHVNKISALLKPSIPQKSAYSARFYCDSSMSQTRAPNQLSAAASDPYAEYSPAMKLSRVLVSAAFFGGYIFGIYVPFFREMLWNPERAEKKMLNKLARKKNESMEAFLETLDSELNTLETKLNERGADGKKVRIYEREIAALKKMFYTKDVLP